MPILEDGQLFERYRVHRWLGSGIAGESYEAEDRILQRKVTLKLIHPWATLPDSARRQFFREMQGISLLNHPHLATVLDYGETDGRIYVARRYVSSGSLLGSNGRLWFHPPLPATDAFKYAHQLAQALQYIHQHGYLHGSFTFANVLVLRGPNTENDTDYAPFLMADVGLANFVRRFGHPRIETLPVSAAPEQLDRRVVPASDQFALAVLLYFWLAGRPPYLGAPDEVEQQKLSETITPLSILNPSITLEQDSIILRALAAYPEDRYPSVLAFAEDLIASLSSPTRLYAHPLASQPETPQADTHTSQESVFANSVEAEPRMDATQLSQITADAAVEQLPDQLQPAQTQTEPYRSALEELLALPRTSNDDERKSLDEGSTSEEGETQQERAEDQSEEHALFPILPETPPVGEFVSQSDLTSIVAQESAEPASNRQTGPLAAEPTLDITHTQTAETTLEMPADLPDSQDDFLPLNELPATAEETPASFSSDEPPSLAEEETPTVPREEFASIEDEHKASLAHEQFALTDEVPTASPEQAVISEETPIASSAELAQPDTGILPAFKEASTPLPDEATVAGSEEPEAALASDEAVADEAVASFDLPALSDTKDAADVPQQEFAVNEDGFVVYSLDDLSPFSELASPVIFPDESLPLREETASDDPAQGSATSSVEDEAASSSTNDSISEVESASKPVQEDHLQVAEEDSPVHPDTAKVAEENTGDTPAEAVESVIEAPDPVKEAEESTDAREETSDITEEHTPSQPPVEPKEERAEADHQAEVSLPSAREHVPTESVQQAAEDTPTSSPLLNEQMVLPPRESTPMQETPETSNATYAPIDEAIVAPRLLISSPYTSSSYEFLLTGEETNIGRAGASDLYLEQDNLTSRHHALLKRIGERVLIFDKRSHNGVFLNGQKIEVGRGYELADGDHIGIGNYELIFRSAPAGHISQLI